MPSITMRSNLIILYANDVGFAGVGCCGGTGIPTPNVDALARDGLPFKQGCATAATCWSSRFSLLTGSYPMRNKRLAILKGGDASLIIPPDAVMLPTMLWEAG